MSKFIVDKENIAVCVVDNEVSKTLLRGLVVSLLTEDGYSEGLNTLYPR
jgi:hypothetical protein